ncbi:MAG: ABC transporter ATP-binding protein [Enterococcus sp.]
MPANKKNVFQRFLPYLMIYRVEFITAIIFGCLSGATSVYMTYQIGQAVDVMVGLGAVDFSALDQILFLFAGVVLLTVISQLFIQRISNRIAYLSTAELRKKTFAHLNQLPLSFYDSQVHGNIISRFTNDMDNLSLAIAAVFNQLFTGVTIVVIALVVMLQMSPILTAVVLIATPIIFLVNWLVAKASQENFVQQQKIVGDISGFVTEMVGNQKIVKAFQQEATNQQKFEELNQELYLRGQKAQFTSSLTNPLSRFVDHLAYLAVGLVGGLLIINGSSLVTIGTVSSFTIYASQFTKPFIEISGITTQIQTAIAGLKRTFELLDQEVEPLEAPSTEKQTIRGEVTFKQVAFAYQPNHLLINDFSFTANPGETIAIVGRTGAGKSTLVNLLMRFYEPTSGTISIDGQNIQDIPREQLRQYFGMVLQDTWLFDGTLRDNLLYGRQSATENEIHTALQKTAMYEFVQRLPHKLDTKIGQGGLKISDGQRQLLTIARTMISNPQMLILDEATSSVDTLTEAHIQQAFLAMMQGRTSFVIAHRLSTIRSADQILVMDDGQIVEQGTHEFLLTQNGYYTRLYQAQFEE